MLIACQIWYKPLIIKIHARATFYILPLDWTAIICHFSCLIVVTVSSSPSHHCTDHVVFTVNRLVTSNLLVQWLDRIVLNVSRERDRSFHNNFILQSVLQNVVVIPLTIAPGRLNIYFIPYSMSSDSAIDFLPLLAFKSPAYSNLDNDLILLRLA
jgi:hypothetical protein